MAKKLLAERSRSKNHGKNAAVFALRGDLGAGKTTFVQGFFNGLGLKRRAQSPTFIIMRRHSFSQKKNVFHIDAYRLKEAGEMKVLNFKEIVANPHNAILIEWPERIRKLLPKNTTWIWFQHGKKENERKITIKNNY